MNGTNTLVGPGAGDAALLRVKGTGRALALAIDGPGPARVGALDPYLAGVSAVVEGALNVACHGADPDRDHRLPELRLARDRPRRVAARAGDRRDRRRVPRAGRAGRVRQRQPLQRDAGRADPADAGGRHGRAAGGSEDGAAHGVGARRRGLAARRARFGRRRARRARSSPGVAGFAGASRPSISRPPAG